MGGRFRGHAIIKINGEDYSKNTRGFNFVVVNADNGKFVFNVVKKNK